MDRDDALHQARVDGDAAEGRVDVALERGAGAERDDGHVVPAHRRDDLGHLLRSLCG